MVRQLSSRPARRNRRGEGSPRGKRREISAVAAANYNVYAASGWDHAMRWNAKSEFLVFNGNYPGVDDAEAPSRISQGRVRAETRKTFGERPATAYAPYQRSLCNKCHAKDSRPDMVNIPPGIGNFLTFQNQENLSILDNSYKTRTTKGIPT